MAYICHPPTAALDDSVNPAGAVATGARDFLVPNFSSVPAEEDGAPPTEGQVWPRGNPG